jgi:hypothetical protein
MKRLAQLTLAALIAGAAPLAVQNTAQAQEIVSIGWGRALLTMPAAKPRAVVVLVPGGDGDIGISADGSVERDRNWIVRTRGAYLKAGIASLLLDAGADIGTAITEARKIAPRVVVVAMSRGSTRIPAALSARPDGLVLASSFLDQVQTRLGDAGALPPTLVIHHRRDDCQRTHFEQVPGFMSWAGPRARLVWIDGGQNEGNPCGNRAYRGFVGREGAVVSAIIGFVGRGR